MNLDASSGKVSAISDASNTSSKLASESLGLLAAKANNMQDNASAGHSDKCLPIKKNLDSKNSTDSFLDFTDVSKLASAGHGAEKRLEAGKPPEEETKSLPVKVGDITGPEITGRFNMPLMDLGASIVAPNGKLISVFGDTFSGERVGEGWRHSPFVLIGDGDANTLIQYDHAAHKPGEDPRFADPVTAPYDDPQTTTMIPSDLLRVGDTLYLHASANHGFGNVAWTGIWSSNDNGETWNRVAKFPGDIDGGLAQNLSWDYNPDDGHVYVASTLFDGHRDKGIILRRVLPEDLADDSKYELWDPDSRRWVAGDNPNPKTITPPGETWGELSFRRLDKDHWILGGLATSEGGLGFRVIDSPTEQLYTQDSSGKVHDTVPLQVPIKGADWDKADQSHIPQVYGGYILPGSKLDSPDGVGLVVSQWNNIDPNDPRYNKLYHVMQYKVTLQDTTKQHN